MGKFFLIFPDNYELTEILTEMILAGLSQTEMGFSAPVPAKENEALRT